VVGSSLLLRPFVFRGWFVNIFVKWVNGSVFYRWLRKCEHPEEVSWIRIKVKSAPKLPEELLTVEEINKLVNAAEHVRDKAFILTLYESGCRIGELLALQI